MSILADHPEAAAAGRHARRRWVVYNASSVPIIQLALSSNALSQTALNDLALNFIRPQLATIPGAQLPYPYGGAAPPGADRSRPEGAARSRNLGQRRRRRAGAPEPDHARSARRRVGRLRVDRRPQRLAEEARGVQRPADQGGQRRRDLHARRRLRPTTARRRRRTWSSSTARRAC